MIVWLAAVPTASRAGATSCRSASTRRSGCGVRNSLSEPGSARLSGAGSERLLRRRSSLSSRFACAESLRGAGGRLPSHWRTNSQRAKSPFRLAPRAVSVMSVSSRSSMVDTETESRVVAPVLQIASGGTMTMYPVQRECTDGQSDQPGTAAVRTSGVSCYSSHACCRPDTLWRKRAHAPTQDDPLGGR
jgi:hypothetical protein